ncbi:uncharacterized protein LOC131659610 [Vicia villosa]|uniref:uncharacterized protein LOC131659610 n=1 Tax=Vicia villosa TaxID=3911 RepID=UPI00273BD666|nr:uncharacterized protein LOC131659610 [Vicia villosa]
MDVPFKIKAFGWRLFRNRLPTKDLLLYRGTPLSLDNLNCVLCGICVENMKHLFFSCMVVKNIRREIALWVGKVGIGEEDGLENFMNWYRYFRVKKVKERKLGVVWLATNWTIWLLRNGVSFRKDKWSINDTIWNIKMLVWRWTFCGKITHSNFSFYEFSKDPLLFLS